VFLPLCGKTRDIAWLLAKGYRVAGAELSKVAIEQLFNELKTTPEISQLGSVTHFRAKNIDIFVGDIFELSSAILGPVDAIYDRAALVALPEEMRQRYSAHLMRITNVAPQLLIAYEYNQSLMDGPPFSVSIDEVRKHYGSRYNLTELGSVDVPGGMRGRIPAKERVQLLMAI
jgi:thiopurine S-methyltransferase